MGVTGQMVRVSYLKWKETTEGTSNVYSTGFSSKTNEHEAWDCLTWEICGINGL